MIETPLATVDDFKARYDTFYPDNKIKIYILDTSNYIRQVFRTAGRNIDREIKHYLLSPINVISVVCGVANRSLPVSNDSNNDTGINTGGFSQQVGTKSISETTGGVSYNLTYENPNGDMYLLKAEKEKLGLLGTRINTYNPFMKNKGVHDE
jgi:hypothetical protein